MEYRLLISSNSAEWRDCLAAAFESHSKFRLLGTFSTPGIVEAAANQYPDIILWEVNEGDPLPVISEINVKSPLSRLVIVLRDPGKYDMQGLVDSGIRGCLPVRLLPQQIVRAVELIVDAGVLCLPRFGPEYNGRKDTVDISSVMGLLTKREQDVLSMLGKGNTNQEISSALYISESTVKSHLRSIFRKLGVRKRSEAQAMVARAKIPV
jgi:DNA-binding NarL/FixJ family response regulator